jgi:hypothetical protein
MERVEQELIVYIEGTKGTAILLTVVMMTESIGAPHERNIEAHHDSVNGSVKGWHCRFKGC